jgi:hypothetical protein
MKARTDVTAEDLMVGVAATYEITIPPEVLRPGPNGNVAGQRDGLVIKLRPLSIGVFQLIMKAAREDPGLIPVLMIKESLVRPSMSVEQVKQLHLSMVSFLVDHIRTISGLVEKKTP